MNQVSALEILGPLSLPLHLLCIDRFANESATPLLETLGAALVCGEDLAPGELKSLFLRLGLYHILVVSGAHLIFLSELLARFPLPGFLTSPWKLRIRVLILASFAMMTGFGAPIVRAGFHLYFRQRFLAPAKVGLLLSMIAALSFHPPWIHSLSLFLSFLASLGLLIGQRPLTRLLFMSLFTLPLVLPLGSVNALGLIVGLMLSPVFELILFPLSLVAAIIQPLQALLEILLEALIQILKDIATLTPASWAAFIRIPTETIWIFALFCYFISPFKRASLDKAPDKDLEKA